MGIFESIAGGLERFAGSQFGEAAFGLAGQFIQTQFQPQQQFPFPSGGPPAPAPVSVQLQTGGFAPAGRGFAQQPVSFPFDLGGGPPMPGVFQTTALGGGALQIPQPRAFALDPSCPSLFSMGPPTGGARPIRLLMAQNPVTGKNTFWEHAGQPVLFSRDLAVCRRVRKIAGKAGTVSRRRTRKR